jgi:glucose/arabinose dehydrogenase
MMLFYIALYIAVAAAQSSTTASCSSTIAPKYPTPSVAQGWEARIIRNGLHSPRGLIFDSNGKLLVVEEGTGITALTLDNAAGACVGVSNAESVVSDKSVSEHMVYVQRHPPSSPTAYISDGCNLLSSLGDYILNAR